MAYRKPGAYARFVRTAGAVNSPGATRVMALVGTGEMFFESYNEALIRNKGTSSDKLNYDNVIEVMKVTNKPLKNGELQENTVEYKLGEHFELINDRIAWNLKADPEVEKEFISGIMGPVEFADSVAVDKGEYSHLIQDGIYRIEITHIDGENPDLGTYAVINHSTEEILGEYKVSNDVVKVIPGVNLVVPTTFFNQLDENGQPVTDSTGRQVSITKEGDHVLIKTKAGLVEDGLPEGGDIYYVYYKYKKAEEDLVPKIFTDYMDVVNEYGNYTVTASGKVINSLALGAEIAFLNGVQPLVLVQAKNDSDYEMKKAIDKLQKDVPGITNINTVVPLTTSKNVAIHAMNHVTYMSSEAVGKERMLYVSAEDGESPELSAKAASDFNNERVVYVAPGAGIKEVKDINTGRVSLRRIPGCYLAIAVAAIGLRNDPAEPLTNKNITGFASLGELYTESEKNLMAENGVLLLEQHGYNMRVRHGITTSTLEVNSAEITLIQIKDYVIEAARKTLGELYVGRKLMPSVLGDIQATLQNILAQFQAQEIIIGFGGLNVRRSSEDPRAVDVNFEIEAVYPLNYINISFSFSGVN